MENKQNRKIIEGFHKLENNMQGTNSFFRYKDIHRYTWAARGQ
jgi:hypothetical protein